MLAREPVIPGTDRPFKVDPTKIRALLSVELNKFATSMKYISLCLNLII